MPRFPVTYVSYGTEKPVPPLLHFPSYLLQYGGLEFKPMICSCLTWAASHTAKMPVPLQATIRHITIFFRARLIAKEDGLEKVCR